MLLNFVPMVDSGWLVPPVVEKDTWYTLDFTGNTSPTAVAILLNIRYWGTTGECCYMEIKGYGGADSDIIITAHNSGVGVSCKGGGAGIISCDDEQRLQWRVNKTGVVQFSPLGYWEPAQG